MENFELVQLPNGIISLRALHPRETFHPGVGPAEEARILHVEQQRLVERCLASKDFRLWDVGLGAGANALTAIRALQNSLTQDQNVTITSFDQTLAPINFALKNASALQYPLGFEDQIRELITYGKVQITPQILWELNLGDFTHVLNVPSVPAPDSIFYDPYSPAGNPEMWTLQNFSRLYDCLDPQSVCLLTNYTRSTQIRVTLLMAGFFVGIGCFVHEKAETTIASNRLEALERPLEKSWLINRVRASRNAAPLRSASDRITPISESDFEILMNHPQWQM